MFVHYIVDSLIRRAVGAGVVLVGVGGFVAYDQYDKKANFTPVQARVTDVNDICYMERRSGRTREWSENIPCDRAEMAVKYSPKWTGFDIRHKITVSYEYLSPVDKRTHTGKHEYSYLPEGKPINRGQLLTIRASKSDPAKTREI